MAKQTRKRVPAKATKAQPPAAAKKSAPRTPPAKSPSKAAAKSPAKSPSKFEGKIPTKKVAAKSVAAPAPGDDYSKTRDRAGVRAREQSAAGRDIGKIPPVENQQRRDDGRESLERFARTYFPEAFYLTFSRDHLRVIESIETAIRSGGQFALAMPRGSGKTTLCVVSALWALLHGFHSFLVLIGSTEAHAQELVSSIRTALETNDLLAADFPEVCFPIRALEGIQQRRLLLDGHPLTIKFTASKIVFPDVPGAVSACACVRSAGITGRIRGMQHTQTSGARIRPSLVIIDDPQTDESARSPSQCDRRMSTLNGAVLGLAGPGKAPISALMPCTIIESGDLADRALDRKANPQWQGQTCKLIYSWATRQDLWDQYAALRAEGQRDGSGTAAATKFYKQNRKAMDAGSEVAWPERKDPDQLSALQHAYDLRLDRGEAAFAAEYQNEPLKPSADNVLALTAAGLESRLNRTPRGQVPPGASQLVAAIDVQGEALYWLVAAGEPGFTGSIVDYGTFPQQGRAYFTLRDLPKQLRDVFPGVGPEAQIFAGLQALFALLLDREWPTATGGGERIRQCLVDAQWGAMTDTVYRACRSSPHAGLLLPGHGEGITASRAPMESWQKRPGETRGRNWVIRKSQRGIDSVVIDTNYWKTFTADRLLTPLGAPGHLTLPGDSPGPHRMLIDHLLSETRQRTEGRGRVVDVWELKPGLDNHWWDCLVSCQVALSITGLALAGADPAVKPRKTFTPPPRRYG